MLNISSILGKLIKEHQMQARQQNRDSRLIVPGLSPDISEEIHNFLHDHNITSYLVIGDESNPDKDKKWIKPIGLTSKRIGSFVAVVSPGQLTQIHDSISGTGGALRSQAFSEEWPWVDNNTESFRFSGIVLDELLSLWDSSDEDKSWLKTCILDYLIPSISTHPQTQKIKILLEDILENLNNKYPEIENIKLKLLFSIGIPKPDIYDLNIEKIMKRTSKLRNCIVEKLKKDDMREDLISNISKVFPDDMQKQNNAKLALDVFLDKLGNSSFGDICFLHGCWGNNITYWNILSCSNLEKLFEITYDETIKITCNIECDKALISNEHRYIATFYGEYILFSGECLIPESELEGSKWVIKLMYRGKPINGACDDKVSSGKYDIALDLKKDFASVKAKQSVTLKLVLESDGNTRGEVAVKLDLCCDSRKAFMVIEPTYQSANATEHDDYEDIEKFAVKDNIKLHFFSFEGMAPVLDMRSEIKNRMAVKYFEKLGTYSTGELRPSQEHDGRISFDCNFNELTLPVCLESSEVTKCEFTLEEEFILHISGVKTGGFDEILDIFEGNSKQLYSGLASADQTSYNRLQAAKIMIEADGWKPILTDFIDFSGHKSSSPIGEYIIGIGNPEAPAFNNLVMPEKAEELIKEYELCRSNIITKLHASLNSSEIYEKHLLYATHPVYIDNIATDIENLIVEYLLAYKKILDHIEDYQSKLGWEQLFILLNMDCLINWGKVDSVLRSKVILLGPWHPLILSKRYMIQSALVLRAKRLNKNEGKLYRHLVGLLKDISGCSWVLGSHESDVEIESFYLNSTSDPGWHLAVSAKIIDDKKYMPKLIGSVAENFGLDIITSSGNYADLVYRGLSDYMQAFPSKRAIGIKIGQEHNIDEIISSVSKFIHSGDELTDVGKQLIGGISIFCEEDNDLEDMQYSEPPILVYHDYSASRDWFAEANPDIYMIESSCKRVFEKITGERYMSGDNRNDLDCSLPRGADKEAVFNMPLCRLTSGKSMLPNSISVAYDENSKNTNGIGAAYVSVLSKLSNLQSKWKAISSVNLPERINCPWIVAPGLNIDPAIFVKYVRDGKGHSIQYRTLWDYKVDIGKSSNTYYVLSTVPRGFVVAIKGFFETDKDIASEFIEELGSLGIAIGGEALKSGRRAMGVIGLVGSVRMLSSSSNNKDSMFIKDTRNHGFLIPVDSFSSFFGKVGEDNKRSDLLAIQIMLPDNDSEKLVISACAVEAKFVSSTLSRNIAFRALEQAESSLKDFKKLANLGSNNSGIPERLGLLSMLRFGLRISSPSNPSDMNSWMRIEQEVYKAILRGNYEYRESKFNAIVFSTEAGLNGSAEMDDKIYDKCAWVRMNKNNWPGVSDTTKLDEIRKELSSSFRCLKESRQPQALSVVIGQNENEPQNIPDITDTLEKVKDNNKAEWKESADSIPKKVEDNARDEENSVLIEANVGEGSESYCDNKRVEKFIIGMDHSRTPIYFDPQSEIDSLSNLNLMITGSSGMGKTQLLKYVICKLRGQGKEVLVLDFKNDFASDKYFTEVSNIKPMFVNFDGLPFNPLIPYSMKHPETGRVTINIRQHIAGVASVLARIYGLGAQQEMAVKQAIIDAMQSTGINKMSSCEYDPQMIFPVLDEVGDLLRISNIQAYNRLDPLFNLDLFRMEYKGSSFHSLTSKSMILDLSKIQNDNIKNAIAELIILSAHAYFNSLEHSGSVRQVFVIDEAHRVLKSEVVTKIVRECRAYGIGIILSSQYPSDFPEEISSSMATKILHGNGKSLDKVRSIEKLMGSPKEEKNISRLDRFNAYIDNKHSPHTLVSTMNYPLYLVLSFLESKRKATVDEISGIDGLDTEKLPINDILLQLESRGLIERKGNEVRLLGTVNFY